MKRTVTSLACIAVLATAACSDSNGSTDWGIDGDAQAGSSGPDGGVDTGWQGGPEAGGVAPPVHEGGLVEAGGEGNAGDAQTGDAQTGDGGAGDTDSGALAAKQKVLAFLNGISGNKSAIGVEDKNGLTTDSDTMAQYAGGGQYPSFWSSDWGFGGAASDSARESIVQEGEKQWASGAIVDYIYHACSPSWGSDEGCDYSGGQDPINGSFNTITDAQWMDLVTPGGSYYQVWISRLDTISKYFLELQAAGVAPLFRVFHEMNGQWAWWQGRPGPNGSLKLFQITHDYLVQTKGLTNIIWVWNLQDYTTLASDTSQYTPGTDYFDIAALDVYNTGYTTGNYQAMTGISGGKPIAVAECAQMIDPGTLQQQPLWVYLAMWPDFFGQNTSSIPALFNDSQVLNLSQMPGW
jgi:hypothetical protein